MGASPPDVQEGCTGGGLVVAGLVGAGAKVLVDQNGKAETGRRKLPIPSVSARRVAIILSRDCSFAT